MGLFKRNEGAITVYLSIILSVMLVLTGVFVDGARARAAEAQVQSVAEAAANSLLAEYNNILKEWFGLMAISENNPDVLEEELLYYMNRNLMTELGAQKPNLSDESWNYVRKFLDVNNEYKDVKFLDMYDYLIEDVSVQPMYNLTENEVIRAQIVEHMKYRAPEVLGEEFLEKINVFKSYKKQSEVLSSKLKVDSSLSGIKKALENLSKAIGDVNKYDQKVLSDKIKEVCEIIATKVGKHKVLEQCEKETKQAKEALKNYKKSDSYKEEVKRLKEERSKATDKAEKDSISQQIEDLCLSYENDIEAAEEAEEDANNEYLYVKKEASNEIEELDKNIDEFNVYNENAKGFAAKVIELSTDIEHQIQDIRTKLTGDNSDFAEKMKQEMSKIEKQVKKESMLHLIAKFDSNINVLGNVNVSSSLEQKLAGMDLNGIDRDTPGLKDYGTTDYIYIHEYIYKRIMNIDDLINNNVLKYSKVSSSEFQIEKTTKSGKKIEDPRKVTNDLVDSSNNPLKELDTPKEHDDFAELLKGLPSGDEKKISSEDILKAFLGEDYDFAKKAIEGKYGSDGKDKKDAGNPEGEDKEEAGDIVDGMDFTNEEDESTDDGLGLISELIGFLEDGLENIRDEIYVDEYALGTFNNFLSTKEIKVKTGNTISQVDLRGRARSEHKPYQYFDNEIEYILGGSSNDNLNVSNVMAKILLIRFVLNTIYIYRDGVKYKEAYIAATAIAGWTGFGVPIVQTLIMLSWAMAEAVLDVKSLMSGESVVIFKTSETWVLSAEGGLAKIKDKIQDTLAEEAKDYAKKAVDYGTDTLEQKAKNATQNIHDTINTKVDIVVEKFFSPVEDALNSADKTIKDNYAEITGSLENELSSFVSVEGENNEINDEMSDIIKEIYKLAEEEYKNAKTEVQNTLTRPISEAKEKIEQIKENIKTKINGKLSALKNSIDNKITEAKNSGKEALNKCIDSFGSKSGDTSAKGYGNIKASLLSLNYEEYLRLFLLMTNRDKKITRIQDLIQLRMVKMTENEDFKLSNCNTYIGVKANVSMKYFFMSQPFVKKELKTEDYKRHKLSVVLLKGY